MTRNFSLLLSIIITASMSSVVDARLPSALESTMFRSALQDNTMQYLVQENFSDINIVVSCAVLSLQWQSGRILGSSPSNPGGPDVPLLMYGMAEVTLFAANEFPSDEVKRLTKKALEKFEQSEDFRETSMSVCSTLMVAPLRYVMQKNNLLR